MTPETESAIRRARTARKEENPSRVFLEKDVSKLVRGASVLEFQKRVVGETGSAKFFLFPREELE